MTSGTQLLNESALALGRLALAAMMVSGLVFGIALSIVVIPVVYALQELLDEGRDIGAPVAKLRISSR